MYYVSDFHKKPSRFGTNNYNFNTSWDVNNELERDETKKDPKNDKTKIRRWLSKFDCTSFFRDFCNETSIHGFNHIVAEGRHLFEKIGWAIATLLAALGAIELCLEQWRRFVANPTVVSLEKDYRTWNNTFLALTACMEMKSLPPLISKFVEKQWNVKESDEKYDYYRTFVEMVANATLTNLDGFENYTSDNNLKGVDLFNLALEVAPPFKVALAWFDRSATTNFVNVMTDMGICYTLNSVVSKNQAVDLASSSNNQPSSYPISCHYVTHPCYMRVELYHTCVSYYAHSPYDIVDTHSNKLAWMCPGQDVNTDWKVVETKASDDVKALGIDQRKCRFYDESMSDRYKMYSSGICRRECKNKEALKLCGCSPYFYYQEGGKPCDVVGMACVSKQMKASHIDVHDCSCFPLCVDATYELTSFKESKWTGPFAARSSLKIGILPPRSRYRRQILFCFEDLVVSFGGAAGLFLGCSFLSGIEIVYFVLARISTNILRWLGLEKRFNTKIEESAEPKINIRRRRNVMNNFNEERHEIKRFIRNMAENDQITNFTH